MGFRLKTTTPLVIAFACVSAACLLMAGASTANAQTTRPAQPGAAAKPVKPADPVDQAIQTLTQEFDDAVKNNSSLPRTRSDYFNTAPKPPPERVVNALSQRTARNNEADAYVRWQLLSALPMKLEGDLGVQAGRLLAVAPPLLSMPGTTAPERRDLDRIAQQTKEDQLVHVMSEWQNYVDSIEAKNQPNIRYRNELFQRLPTSRAKIDAGLEDIRQRITAGVAVRDQFRALAEEIRAYAQQSGSAQEMRQLGHSIKLMTNQTKTTFYERLEFNTQQRRAVWTIGEMRIDQTASDELVAFLTGRSSPNSK